MKETIVYWAVGGLQECPHAGTSELWAAVAHCRFLDLLSIIMIDL